MKVPQCDVRQPVWGFIDFRTSAFGNRFHCKQGFHKGIEFAGAWSGEVFGGIAHRSAAKHQNDYNDQEQEAD
jgi:hypothetical protein